MDCKDLHINGGVVGVVNCQGDVHLHGGVVENMTVHHDCYQYGGIIERRVRMVNVDDQNTRDAINEAARRQVKPLTDEINRLKRENAELKRENTELKRKASDKGTIESVRAYNARLSHENSYLKSKIQELRAELEKRKTKPEETPPDDVLVYRICQLNDELTKEKEAHKQEIEDLKYRLNVACEVNAKLRQPQVDDERRSQEIADKHIDILATLMSAYPFTPDDDLEFEFGIPVKKIRDTARALGVIKSKEERQAAVDYLRRQNIQMIERRGGDQGNHVNVKPVQKMAKYGRVLKTYDSIKQAAEDTGMAYKTIQEHCAIYHTSKKRFTKEGFTFRYKDNENKNSKQSR